ncbi:MAG: type II toxin-antitoxin system HicB family antitoxin [Chloroflexota bacterium]|nr:type II toxin-antitoxin system HicB family antitoxin [Chloroflexota bacterium]
MPAKRVLISIDERLLARIDQECARNGFKRSTYLAQLAERELQAAGGPGATPTARAALVALDALLRESNP